MASEDKVSTAAALMLILGEEAAANVMKHLSDDEVRQVSSRFGAVHGRADECAEQLDQLLDASNFPA